MASMEMVGHLATPKAKVPHNKALHQTRRGGVALRSLRPVVEARLAGEGRCSTLFVGISRRIALDECPSVG